MLKKKKERKGEEHEIGQREREKLGKKGGKISQKAQKGTQKEQRKKSYSAFFVVVMFNGVISLIGWVWREADPMSLGVRECRQKKKKEKEV